MGVATARRIGNGRKVLLADYSDKGLQSAAEALRLSGHDIETHVVDVSKYDQVVAFAEAVASGGRVDAVVHTAGLSPSQTGRQQSLEVNLLGTANVLEAFYSLATPGLSVVCVASLAGHLQGSLSPELEQHLATAPLDRLLDHPEIKSMPDQNAYNYSKRGNILRVQAMSKAWGLKGSRVNTVSPGVIYTPMVHEELKGQHGGYMKTLIEGSATARTGTPDDIANVVAFLISPDSSFISGTDILVDGGALATKRWGKVESK